MAELERLARDINAESNNRAGDSDYDGDSAYDTAKVKNLGRSRKKKVLVAAASIPEIDMDDLAEKIKERLLRDLTIREALQKNEQTTNSHQTNVYHGKIQPDVITLGRSGTITVKEFVSDEKNILFANDREETKLKNIFKEATSNNDDKDIIIKKEIYTELDLGDKVSPKAAKNETIRESNEYYIPKKLTSKESLETSAQINHDMKKYKKIKSNQQVSKSIKNLKKQHNYPTNIQKSKLIGYLNEPENSIEFNKEEQKIPKNLQKSKTDSYLNESEETLDDSKEEHKYPKNKENTKRGRNQNEDRESVESYQPPGVAITQNIEWDDYDENNSNVENMPKKKTILPKKPKFKSSTPDFFVTTATAEPYKFEEPIPEHDRVPKRDSEMKPMIPVKVNGKKVYKIML